MNSSKFRAEARKKLDGKWGKAACIMLAYFLVSLGIGFALGIIGLILPKILRTIANLVIEIPMAFGLTKAFVKLYNGEDVGAFDFLSLGFGEFSKSWGITLRIFLKLIVPIALMIGGIIIMAIGGISTATSSVISSSSYYSSYAPVAKSVSIGSSIVAVIGAILYLVAYVWCIIKSYYYQLSFIIASENEGLEAKDVVDRSRELMDGKRGKLFVLQLTFIGWAILGALSLGIGFLWIIPYIQCAIIAFYKYVSGNNNKVEVVEEAPVVEEPAPAIEEPAVEEPVADEPEAESEEPEAEE